MDSSFAKVLAFAVFILLGSVLRRTGLLKEGAFSTISGLVLYVTLPCVLISNLNGIRIEGTMLLVAGLGLLTNLILFAYAIVLSLRETDVDKRDFLRMNLGGFSIGPFAIPYVQAFYPTTGLLTTCMFDVGSVFMSGGGTYCFIVGTREKCPLWQMFRLVLSKLVRSGPLMTFCFIVLLSVLNLRLPEHVITLTKTGAAANTFLCMIMIGQSIDFSMPWERFKQVIKILGLRWIVCLSFALCAYHLLPFEEEVRRALTLVCMAPIPAMSLIYTAHLKGDVAMGANLNSLSVAVSIVAMSVTLMLFGAV